MRRRYGGKRSLRRRGRGRKRSRKHLLSSVDHSSKCLTFSKAIAKGISKKRYDSCTCIVSDHISGVGPDISSLVMTPFQTVFGLTNLTQAFTAFSCMNGAGSAGGSGDQEFTRHANMYTHFRVKCIRFEFVPTTANTGRESVLPCAFGDNGITVDAVAARMDRNQVVSSQVWMLKWPNKSGTFQDFGINFANPGVNHIYNSAALLDPTVIKIPVTEKFAFNWKPKILGYRTSTWRPLTAGGGANTNPEGTFYPVAKKYPWTSIIDNFDNAAAPGIDQQVGMIPVGAATGSAGPYNTTGLRQPMSFPLISVYDSYNNVFVNASGFEAYGRWTMHTVFEFKNKRGYAANQSAALITENIPLQTIIGAQTAPIINI